MRKPAKWISQTDELILEFLSEQGNHQPKEIRDQLERISEDMSYSNNHIWRECKKLADAGLLVNVGGGTYSITEQGEDFLDGDLDASNLPTPD